MAKPNSTFYSVINVPVVVAKGDYCWGPGQDGEYRVCGYFDNEGGYPSCRLDQAGIFNIAPLEYTPEGYVEKPKYCKALETLAGNGD